MLAVGVHDASGCYLGRMRRYPHYVATLFQTWRRWDGVLVWDNAGIETVPLRSEQDAIAVGQKLARERGAIFLGCGPSIQGEAVIDDPRILARWMNVSIEDAQRVADSLRAEIEHARAVHAMLDAIMSEGKG